LSFTELEKRIEEIQQRVRTIDAELVDPEVYTDGRKSKKLQSERSKLTAKLEPLEFEWARRAEED
jgi:protein subunit release factor A